MEDGGTDSLFDQMESRAALVAESILRYVETPDRDSSTTLQERNSQLKEIEVAVDGLAKLVSANDVTSERAIAESLSKMEDFLRLMLRLMQEMITKLITSETTEMPLKLLCQCNSCFVTWTDRSRLFSERLLYSCDGFLHHLSLELKIFHAIWIPTDNHVELSKSVLSILWNIAQEEKCHKALIQNCIPEVIISFCFNSSIQVRWESKSFLAVLYHLTGPWYYPFLRLSVNEVKLLRLCFQNSATSDDHNVILKLGESMVRYSASELALGISGLSRHKANRTAFADPDIIAATFNLLVTGSKEEKIISIQLMLKLVDEPKMCSIILSNHPDMLEALQSLGEHDEVGDILKQDASMLLKKLLDRISGITSTLQEDTQVLKSSTVTSDNPVLQRKKELKRLLTWATREMNKSKVLHNAADNDTTEVMISMIYFISHLCEMLNFKESHLSMKCALQDCPQFLSILQDYMERHFFKALKKPCGLHPLHPIFLALHCTLILSNCNPQFRSVLGRNGILWQLVKNLRSLQMIPGWDKQLFRIAELILLIIANCSLEWNCQQLLAEDTVVNILLPFCKSDYFGIRLGAKSSLSSVSAFMTRQHWRFLRINEHERIAIVDALNEFAESGSYRKQFLTSLCNYYFSLLDLLLLLNAFVENPLNVEVIQSSNIYPALSQILANGTDIEKDTVVELLWKLCRSQYMQLHLLSTLPGIQNQLPVEVFGCKKPLLFSSYPSSQLLDISPELHSVNKYNEVKAELSDLEDLLFETMDEIWRSRVPAAIEGGPNLLDSSMVMSMFIHLVKFFEATDKALHEEACMIIIRMPTFLYLVANVMVKQIEAKASKTDSEQDVLSIMVVFHCLQMWINCCEEMKDHLGHSGIISNIVLLHLHLIQAFPALDNEYVQIAEAILSTVCQCMTRESCRNYLLSLDSMDVIASMTKSVLFQISSNAKMILSSLSRYLPPDYQSSFKLTTGELTDMLQSLDMVLKHGIPEGQLFFSALEILQSFNFFIQFEPNREVMAYSSVYKSIAYLLQIGDETEKRVACELLWKLITKPMSEDAVVITTKKRNRAENVEELQPLEYMSDPGIRLFLLQNYPEIVASLSTLTHGVESQTPLYFCTLLVLMKESAEIIGKDILKTLMFAKGCYMYSKYAECFKLVSWVHQISDDEEVQRRALDLKGKALYYVFKSEKRSLKKGASRITFTSCYNKAREAINLLGLTIDSEVDRVAERLLDQVHFDYVRKTRSPDLVRCLLCRKKRKLKASHVWPNSVLKHLLKCMCSPQQQVFSVPWKDYGSLQTPKQITFPMLCGECEQLLSHCESKFKVEFFSKLYDPEDYYAKLTKLQSIEYGEYLYRFCLSIIFRALPLVDSDISQKGNTDDIYNLFITCRELLLKKDISDWPNKPSIALLISPTSLPEGVPSVPMIDRILHSPGMILLSPVSLDNCKVYHGKASFLLASLGVLNLVVNLDPQSPLLLPPTSMISPNGGTIILPEDCKRFFAIPMGVWKILEEAATSYSKQVFQLPKKLVKSQEWARRELGDLQAMLLGFKPNQNESEATLEFLPDNFDISKAFAPGKSFRLPAGHRILLHMNDKIESWETSIFLAVGTDSSADSQFSCNNPYTVLMLRVPGYIVCIGYFVSRNKAVTTSSLVSSEDKSMLENIETKYKTKTIADTLLPKLLQARGFSSMEALLFWLERVQTLQLDMKCVNSCWYCSGKCDNCMETTSFDRGPVLGYHVGETVRFCDNECIKHYRFNRSSSYTQVLFHKKSASLNHIASHEHFLTVLCGLLDTSMERNKVIARFYCSSSKKERVYILLQVRFVPKQRILAFVPSDDFLPLTCLPNPVPLTDEDMFIIAGLHMVMKSIFAKFDFPDLVSCAGSILEHKSSTTFPEQSLEVPPLQPFIDILPNNFKISSEDQIIICPHPYYIILHKTTKTYATYLLANSTTEIKDDDQFLVLFYNCSVDYTIKAIYAVEDGFDTISVKTLIGSKSQPIQNLSSYDELVVENCKTIVYVELMSMLQERGFDQLGTFFTNYKLGKSTSASKCPETCWMCNPKSA